MEWHRENRVLSEHAQYQVRQVYLWLTSSDNAIVIVSKDGSKWQFPGGKPSPDESSIDTLIREVFEETGINIEQYVCHG